MLDRYRKYHALKIDSPGDRILRITFDKPETMNSLDAEGHRELTYIWRDIDEDENVSSVILTGKGKAFSAGGDFGMIEDMIEDHKARARSWKEARDLVYNIINCSKPIVSAINGAAVGAGLVAGLLADISIAGKSAKIVDGHTRLGVAAGDSAVINWPLLCGMAKAKYHLLLCEPMDGEEAERLGMVSLCVEDNELQEKAIHIAERLRDSAPAATRWTKYALNNWYRMAGPSFDASTALEMLGFASPEAAEGVRSHREKRSPKFDLDSPT
ncbi:MAG: enoyl-CoA hydratase [Thiotrichales bacterium]|nr:enoyl-CoA hydratase [Thiotrichales bacterium]MAX28146.1 enoyl-CoA hydratase [Thiotrichales bacterium]OUX51539.1 MAG: enoyl-CoA hydratase [Methylococcaceae bacterium TMED282]|tara:strand:+ start:3044 stop:3853 length:810 start_codon:yes stop_codon:yes gene_type:complete